jgi:hypothetical protein
MMHGSDEREKEDSILCLPEYCLHIYYKLFLKYDDKCHPKLWFQFLGRGP